jgi:hypothetical protein
MAEHISQNEQDKHPVATVIQVYGARAVADDLVRRAFAEGPERLRADLMPLLWEVTDLAEELRRAA